MEITTTIEPGGAVVTIAGRLDAVVAPELDRRCGDLIAEGHKKIILDLSTLDYISSAGLRSILSSTKKLRAGGGTLSLCRISGMVREIITISGFDSFLPIHDTLEAALSANA